MYGRTLYSPCVTIPGYEQICYVERSHESHEGTFRFICAISNTGVLPTKNIMTQIKVYIRTIWMVYRRCSHYGHANLLWYMDESCH